MKTVLVTGANRGIGREVCRELARRGWKVLLGARDRAKGEEAARRLGDGVEPVELDVASDASVARLRARLVDGDLRLDALVNNAGIYSGHDPRATLETNFFGMLRVTDACLDRLVDGGRVVNVTSGLGALSNVSASIRARLVDPALTREALARMVNAFLDGREEWGTSAYGVSKAAMNAMTKILARELAGRRVKVNAASPGWARTDMGGAGAPRTVEEGAASVLWGVLLADDGPTGGVFQDGRPLE